LARCQEDLESFSKLKGILQETLHENEQQIQTMRAIIASQKKDLVGIEAGAVMHKTQALERSLRKTEAELARERARSQLLKTNLDSERAEADRLRASTFVRHHEAVGERLAEQDAIRVRPWTDPLEDATDPGWLL